MHELVTQLQYRIHEGGGDRALYAIGVNDDGSMHGLEQHELDASIATLRAMCAEVHYSRMRLLETREVAPGRFVADVLVQRLAECARHEARLALLGGSQTGKSTLAGVLADGALDDGRGSARTTVMRHVHEIESGATSSIAHQPLGFSADGALLNRTEQLGLTLAEVCETAERLVTLLDLCGEPRYLKTTLYGLAAHAPDGALLCVGADGPLPPTARLHLALAAALRLPIAVLLTRVDLADVGADTSAQIVAELLALGFPAPRLVDTWHEMREALGLGDVTAGDDDTDSGSSRTTTTTAAVEASAPWASAPRLRSTPMVRVSALTGEGLELVKRLLARFPCRDWESRRGEPLLLSIDDCHAPPSSEPLLREDDPWRSTPTQETPLEERFPIVSGTVLRGALRAALPPSREGCCTCEGGVTAGAYLIGPDAKGRWLPALAPSIKYKELTVESVLAGQSATVELQVLGPGARLRRGMVIVEASARPRAVWNFCVEVASILAPARKVAVGGQLIVHCLGVKQAAKVVAADEPVEPSNVGGERIGELRRLHLRFLFAAEFIMEDAPCVIREGGIRDSDRPHELAIAVGRVVSCDVR